MDRKNVLRSFQSESAAFKFIQRGLCWCGALTAKALVDVDVMQANFTTKLRIEFENREFYN